MRFGAIVNPGLVAFINRNYMRGDGGCYFFQNGPQKVFVDCEYTPYVYRLNDDLSALIAHTGEACGRLHRLLLDDEGSFLLDAECGPGVVLDRDLPAVVARLCTPQGTALEPERLADLPLRVSLLGEEIAVEAMPRAEVPRALRFAPHPAPGGPESRG